MMAQNENPIINMGSNCYEWQIVECFPLTDIPVELEDAPVHTAENGYCCGDPTCYCAAQEVQ